MYNENLKTLFYSQTTKKNICQKIKLFLEYPKQFEITSFVIIEINYGLLQCRYVFLFADYWSNLMRFIVRYKLYMEKRSYRPTNIDPNLKCPQNIH